MLAAEGGGASHVPGFQWLDNDGTWQPFSDAHNALLTDSLLQGMFTFSMRGSDRRRNWLYLIDLTAFPSAAMTQTNTKTHSVRHIRWDPAQLVPAPLQLPKAAPQGLIDPAVGAGSAAVPPAVKKEAVEIVCAGCCEVPPGDVPVEDCCDCCICMCELVDKDASGGAGGGATTATVIRLLGCCSAFVHRDCMQGYLDSQTSASVTCPLCQHIYGVRTGSQPLDGRMVVKRFKQGVEGHETEGTIEICYSFKDGLQGPEHAHPGVPYTGTRRKAYLPDNAQGNLVLQALATAFERRLIFTIGQSVTSGRENQVTWNGIHHKTKTSGGTARYGWPDATYFDRVTEELKAKGIYVGSQDILDKENTSAE